MPCDLWLVIYKKDVFNKLSPTWVSCYNCKYPDLLPFVLSILLMLSEKVRIYRMNPMIPKILFLNR